MRINILRCAALLAGLSAAGTSLGQYPNYPPLPPQGYANPNPSAMPLHPSLVSGTPATAVSYGQYPMAQPMPAPVPYGMQAPQAPAFQGYPQQVMQPAPMMPRVALNQEMMPPPGYAVPQGAPQAYAPTPAPMPYMDNAGCSSCATPAPAGDMVYASPYPAAAYGSCGPQGCGQMMPMMSGPVPLRNWFGGGKVLFLDVEEECDRALVFDTTTPSDILLSTNDVGLNSSTGFDVFFGRYLACGKYAIMANYWYLNPSEQTATATAAAAGDYAISYPAWDRAETAADNMLAQYNNATAYRIRRDSEFHNVEINFVCFGIGGASRAGVMNCNPCGGCGPCGNSCNPCGSLCGCAGGPCGPIMPACSCRLRTQFGHGLRWMRYSDDFEFAASLVDAGYGATDDDLYYNLDVTNDLIGYQLTGRLDYCLGNRFSLFAAGKSGIYVNNVDFASRLGTGATTAVVGAYYPLTQGQDVVVNASESVLAFMGELDLGMTYNVNPCWSITGGYRIIGVSGIATAPGQIAADVANISGASQVCANQSLLLHGAFVGASYNY